MRLKFILLFVLITVLSNGVYAQLDNNIKAKLYFTEAQKMYEQGDFENSLKYINKAESILGKTVARTLALKIKVEYNLGNFIKAKDLFDNYTTNYMQSGTEELNDEVLELFINIEEAAKAAAEAAAKRGNFTDLRDGKTYKTIKIGNQVWMAENLNYDAGSGCWCYDNNSRNCDQYGRLYNWETAKRACPDGWHLPSKSEFENLLDNYGGEGRQAYTTLKNGGSSGFSALFGGSRDSDGDFSYLGVYGRFWSSSEYDSGRAWYLLIYSYDKKAYMGTSYRSWGFSVRCFQD